MKCAEVIEWMHRYLDHDLSREEITEMFRHIDDCLPCAEIFDRLTTLSQQLEQLPDVKAPFSLVDSILPQLEELDRGVLNSGKGGAGEEVVVPFSREASQVKRQKGSSMARRTGFGAVAAALILGIAIFNMPEQMPGAQVEERLMKDSASNTASDSSNKSASNNAGNSEESSKMNMDTAITEDATAGSGFEENSLPEESSLFDTGVAESAMPSMEGADSTNSPTESGVPAAVDHSSTPEPAKSATPPKDNKSTQPAATASPSPLPSSTDFDLRSTLSDDEQQPSADQSVNDADAGMMESMKIPEGDNDKTINEQGIMGFLPSFSEQSELSWTSSDGQYMAVVEGQQLVIYSIPPSGIALDKLPLTSIPLAGAWVSGEWASDSLQFKYVTDNNGISSEHVFVTPDSGIK